MASCSICRQPATSNGDGLCARHARRAQRRAVAAEAIVHDLASSSSVGYVEMMHTPGLLSSLRRFVEANYQLDPPPPLPKPKRRPAPKPSRRPSVKAHRQALTPSPPAGRLARVRILED